LILLNEVHAQNAGSQCTEHRQHTQQAAAELLSKPAPRSSNWLFVLVRLVAAPAAAVAATVDDHPLPVMRRSERLERRRRSARQHASRRCQGCKDAVCVRPVVTHWGCERARPGQHSANALRKFGAEVVRRAAGDADHQDQDQDPARRDARPRPLRPVACAP
jgi:hypothetical protein